MQGSELFRGGFYSPNLSCLSACKTEKLLEEQAHGGKLGQFFAWFLIVGPEGLRDTLESEVAQGATARVWP